MKTILSIIIIALAFSIAFYVIYAENKHIKNLSLSLKLVNKIKNNALVYNNSFTDTIISMKPDEEFKSFDFIKKFRIEFTADSNPIELWKKCLYESTAALYDYEKDVLIELVENLAQCSISDVSVNCNNACKQLEEFQFIAKENKNKKSKTSAVLTVSMGFTLVLMLI